MADAFWTGLLEGFRGRGEEVYQQALKDDAARRQTEAGVFSHLLQSRDPQIRALALQGIMEGASPSPRKRGIRGVLGELQTSSTFPAIQQIANELVPDEPPTPQGSPATAAMSTNAPVLQPSAPITNTAPIQAQVTPAGTKAPELDMLPAGSMGQAPVSTAPPDIPQAPPAPAAPVGPVGMHPRGTGVPTAEEIAEFNATIGPQTRIKMAKQYLDEESAKRAIMGILGAPQTTRQFGAPTFAVIDPINGEPVPVAFDYSSGAFYFTDGTRVPRGAKFVQMSRASAGSGLSSYVEDSPEQRAQLQAAYPNLELPPGKSPTGYLKIQVRPDGSAMAIPSEFTPPPAFSGTGAILEPGSNVPIRAGIPRGGGRPVPLGDEPRTEVARVQQAAQGLLAAVDKIITQEQVGPGGSRKRVTPQRMDQIVKEQAATQGLPYQKYAELQQAAKVSPDITPRQEREQENAGMSMADRVRARALKNRQGGGTAPVAPVGPPQKPSARSQGPGPVR